MVAKCLLGILIFLMAGELAFSQARLRGVVRDAVANNDMPAATVALYRVSDSSLISYQLSTDAGAFHFQDVPVGKPLYIKVFYTGYKGLQKHITLRGDTDLHAINLFRSDKQLKEVEIKGLAPVQMNGDTLEFNADAFKLEASSVGEDLLKKLPGVTVWSDGTITVNGKKVNNVMVDGKPFFGGKTNVATQNIPKSAIDKIQVFQEKQKGVVNPDSTTSVNIKLKKDKNFGYFGKVSAGAGTGGHYEGNASLNFFKPGTQLGVSGSTNNVNKSGSTMDDMMEQSTFKHMGASFNFMPNFQAPGIHTSRNGGLSFQHSFGPPNSFQVADDISGNVTLNGTQSHQVNSSHTTLFLGGDSTQEKDNSSTSDDRSDGQSVNAQYTRRREQLYTSMSFNAGKTHNISSSNSLTLAPGSSNKEINTHTGDGHNTSLQLSVQHNPLFTGGHARFPATWEAGYQYSTSGNNSQEHRQTSFVAPDAPSQNQAYDQLKQLGSRQDQHQLSGSLGNLATWMGVSKDFAISLRNNLDLNINHTDNTVSTLDSLSHKYQQDNYLSIHEVSHTWNEQPSVLIEKSFVRTLSNGARKGVVLSSTTAGQFYTLQNSADHAERNITRQYQKLVPGGSIRYENTQLSRFQNVYSINYNTNYQYPGLDQLAPLADSTNPFSLRRGNLALQPSRMQDIGVDMRHSSMNPKHVLMYNIRLGVTLQDHMLADSVLIDSLGRSVHYTVNAGGTRTYSLTGMLSKAFRWKTQQLQLMALPGATLGYSPVLINNIVLEAPSWNARTMVSLSYSIKDRYMLMVRDNINYNHSNSGVAFQSTSNNIGLAGSVQCTDRLQTGTNVDYNNNKASGAKGVTYTIWNMNASYRCLKAKTLEVKLVAMDLLHQNKGVNTSASPSAVVQSVNNALQQYFMLSVAYFPRKFGKG